jgi:hypothetical protein
MTMFTRDRRCVLLYDGRIQSKSPHTDLFRVLFIHSSMALRPFVGPWPLLQFRNLFFFYIDDRTPWTSDQPVGRPRLTYRATQTQNKRIRTSTPGVEFEPTIPAFEQAKILPALDRAGTVIGLFHIILYYFPMYIKHFYLKFLYTCSFLPCLAIKSTFI